MKITKITKTPGQEWWSHKEAEMQREEDARKERWAAFRAEHPDASLETLLEEFRKSEAVRFTLEHR